MPTDGIATGPEADSAGSRVALAGARAALILLLIINFFNYIDRYILAAAFTNIRQELLPDDPRANEKLGWLAMAFLVSYTVIAPLFGKLADSVSRWWLIGIGVILWSLASGASGLAGEIVLLSGSIVLSGYTVLFITRCFVGVGEGAYGPTAPTVISDLYPVSMRGQVLAWFYAAIPVGSALGFAFGGQIASSTLGWRWAFYLVTPPGILLGLWCFFMREPLRGQADLGAVTGKRATHLADYLDLLKTPSYVLNCLGMAAMTFALGGLAWWLPDYIVTDRGVKPLFGGVAPSVMLGGLTALAGLTATILGGLVGDWLRPRFPGSYFAVSGFAMLLGFPMILLVLWTPFPACWIMIFLAEFFLFFNTGPTNAILANVTHPAVRAGAFAVNIFVIHILGDVISPPIIGFTRDRTGNLHLGFVLVSVMTLVGGILWLWGTRYLEEDTRRAPTRLNL
jgi:MFS transporter, Spinster family, sphingosine-1-phosphate transporter